METTHRTGQVSERLLRGTSRGLGRAVAAALVALVLGPAGSAAADEAPVVTVQPQDQTVTLGEHTVFESSATGNPSVQWEVSTDNGASFHEDKADPGNTTDTLTVTATSVAQNGWKYRAVFENEAETATSEAARLTVNVRPVVTSAPVDQSVIAGGPASFAAAASGKPAPSVQWQVSTNGGSTFANDTTDPGSATGTLTLASTSLAQNGYQYRAVFKNTAGTATSTSATLTVSAPAALAALATGLSPPAASFAWFPALPHTGERVSLASSSTDPASPINAFAWDTAGNGPFTAGGPVQTTSFSTPGDHVVRLRVGDANGMSSVAAETIHVVPPLPSLMQPFPIVRITGYRTSSGVKLFLFSALAPVGARITVSCHGRGCPARSVTRTALPRRGKRRTSAVLVTFRRFEGTLLRAGLTLEVRIVKQGQIGKYTRFVISRGKLPARLDACLDPARLRPIACPSS
jgi:hypothetical protein